MLESILYVAVMLMRFLILVRDPVCNGDSNMYVIHICPFDFPNGGFEKPFLRSTASTLEALLVSEIKKQLFTAHLSLRKRL